MFVIVHSYAIPKFQTIVEHLITMTDVVAGTLIESRLCALLAASHLCHPGTNYKVSSILCMFKFLQ